MYKGKGLYILAALGLGALVLGVGMATRDAIEGLIESGVLKGEGDDRFHWRVLKVEGEPGFAGVFVGEISPDAEVFEEIARGPTLSGVKGLTLEAIALKPGFSG